MTNGAVLSNLVAWSLQVVSVVAVGGALPWLLRVHAPAVRHGYWRVLLLICLALPVAQPWHSIPPVAIDPDLPAVVPSALAGPATPGAPAGATALSFTIADDRWIKAIAAALVAGAVVRLAWLAAGLVRLRRLRRSGDRVAAGQERDDLDLLVDAGVDIRYVGGLGQPVTFGVLRPVVLLPCSLRSQSPTIRRAVFVHELWHVRRRDWIWVVIEEAVRAVLWFHPAIGWLVSRVQSSREEVVDELTVLATNARRGYLEALLAFADQPPVHPATPFARRRHLFQRMLLISREAVMSSRRIVASCAAMGAVVIVGTSYGVAAFPLRAGAAPVQGQTRDLRPGEPRPASSRELQIRASLTNGAQPLASYLELAKLQDERGAVKEAVATLEAARTAIPNETSILLALASLYQRAGQFSAAVSAIEQIAALQSSDAKAQHLAATFYEEKVRKDAALPPGERVRYIESGIAAEDRALALNADYVDAMIVKNILLRHQANVETNPVVQAQLIAQADQLRGHAIELQASRRAAGGQNPAAGAPGPDASGRMPPPPPPPPPPPGPAALVDGQAPVRVGGNVKQPAKLHNVSPVYPADAMAAGVAGVVILELVIDTAGSVRDARVLRSIPLLDQAAKDAVTQWQFTPTLLNGAPVPVIMTVTVNFSLQ